MVIITLDNYMSATGCVPSTVYRRIAKNILSRITMGTQKYVVYDSSSVTNLCQYNDEEAGKMCPSRATLMKMGIPFFVITEGTMDSCEHTDVQKVRELNASVAQQDCNNGAMAMRISEFLRAHRDAVPDQSLTTGHVKLYRKLLTHSLMKYPMQAKVFMDVLLLASPHGEVKMQHCAKYAARVGVDEYAAALVELDEQHDVISIISKDDGYIIKVSKWNTYQDASSPDKIIVRDMSNPDIQIPQEHENASEGALSLSPTPSISITPIYNNIIQEDLVKKREEHEEKDGIACDTIKKERKPRKRREPKIKTPRDPYKIEDYEPQYRAYVPMAHEVYEYYRDKTNVASVRMVAIDHIIPILMTTEKEDLIACVDNYVAETRKKGWNQKYIKRAQNFFNEYYAAYLPGEMPKNSNGAPPERKKRKEPGPEIKVIKMNSGEEE